MRSFEEYWNEHGDVYAMEIAENAWDYQQSKIDELQKRVDAAQKLIDDWNFGGVHIFDLLDELEQALKSGDE